MMQTVTLQFETTQDVVDFFSRLNAHQMPVPVSATEYLRSDNTLASAEVETVREVVIGTATAPEPEKKPRAPRKPKEEAPAVSTAGATVTTAAAVTNAAATVTTDKPPTIDDVRAALQGYVERAGEGGIKKGMELVATFGATRVSDLKADQYAEFIAKAGV